jgi:arginine-tRNA-protein transferase
MNANDRRLPLYLSAAHACSYLPGRRSHTLFSDPEQDMDMAVYGELLQFGFRRSGRMVYTPRCPACRQCISVRIPVARFSPRRSQRRILKSNRDVVLQSRPAGFDAEHYRLYRAYTAARHEDGEMAQASPKEYLSFLTAPWCDTRFLELREDDRLLGVAVTDRVDNALSAVYTFFDPRHHRRSLGTLAILLQLEQARREGLDYLYLGYWIRDSPKMAYKSNFRPLEAWHAGRWHAVPAGGALPDPDTG